MRRGDMMSHPTVASMENPKRATHIILAGSIGSALEWFDFAVYGYLAPVLGKVFFPSDDPLAVTLSSFAVFSIGYFMRPVGGLLLGLVGDHLGRRHMLLVGMMLMGLSSLLMGLIPGYSQIGMWAPVLLVVMRMFQGLSVGGEYTGAMIYIAETSTPQRRGLLSSLATVGALVGMMCGSAVVALLYATMDAPAMQAWGWRIPFLGGVVVAAIGMVVRAKLPESTEFVSDTAPYPWVPMLSAFRLHWRLMLRVIAIVAAVNIAFYIGFVYLPDQFSQRNPHHAGLSQGINAAILVFQAFMVVAGGWLSDRFGRKRVSLVFKFMLLALVLPMFQIAFSGSILQLTIAQIGLSIPIGALMGIQGALLTEMIPRMGRCSLISLSYSIAMAALASTAPIVAAWMVDSKHWPNGPAMYTMAAIVVSIFAGLGARSSDPQKTS